MQHEQTIVVLLLSSIDALRSILFNIFIVTGEHNRLDVIMRRNCILLRKEIDSHINHSRFELYDLRYILANL